MAHNRDTDRFDENILRMQKEYEKFLGLKKQVKPRLQAFKIIFYYFVLGVLWILLSDRLLQFLVRDNELFMTIQLYKGWFYVAVTGVIFYAIIRRNLFLYKYTIDSILLGYEELNTAYEEIVAMNEDLELQRRDLLISDQRYKLAVEGSREGIWEWDLVNDVYFFSLKNKNSFGYEEDELDNTLDSWKSLIHPDDTIKSEIEISQYLKDGDGFYESTYRVRCKSGEYRWIACRGKAIWDSNNIPIKLAGSHTDITEHIILEESLRYEKEFSESIILKAPIIIIVIDINGDVIQYNPYAEKIFGYTKEEVIGRSFVEVIAAEITKEERQQLLRSLLQGYELKSKAIDIKCKNGKLKTILWSNNILLDKNGSVTGVITIGADISERKELENKLHSLAYYDALTGIPNRIYLKQEVIKALKTEDKVTLVTIDIDDFKHINDTMGHAAGDYFVKHIAGILTKLISKPNFIARISGDSFAILFIDVEDETLIFEQLDAILSEVRIPWKIKGQSFFSSVSIGVASYPEHGIDFSTLMQNADLAMFYQKEHGKDGYTVYDESMYAKTLKYIQMANQLKEAIINEEFLLYYQPQYDLQSGEIIGLEALIRWDHPIKGFIPPNDFIPFSEETGHIIPISEWVLKTVFEQKKEWEKKGYPPIKVSINLSGYIITKTSVMDRLYEIIEELKISPGEIEVEVTETAVMMELDKAKESLNKLKKLGVLIALDDFGTGYSSLTYLQRLPFDILKIDREFIKNVQDENEEMFIFNTIIDLAHKMDLTVVAEGVETKEQRDFLLKNNCDIGQGFYFCRPSPACEIEKLFVH